MNQAHTYLIEAESLWVLGLLPVEKLPEWAASALAAGFETEEILQLAICSQDDFEKMRGVFEAILKASGGGQMSKVEALRQYASQISTTILSGEVSPKEGARLIWEATIKARQQGFHELDPFIYAASEMDDRPKDVGFFEDAIRNEAKRWVTLKQDHPDRAQRNPA